MNQKLLLVAEFPGVHNSTMAVNFLVIKCRVFSHFG